MSIHIKQYMRDLSYLIVDHVYPSCFGVCMFLFINDRYRFIKDDLYDKSFLLGMSIYFTSIMHESFINESLINEKHLISSSLKIGEIVDIDFEEL